MRFQLADSSANREELEGLFDFDELQFSLGYRINPLERSQLNDIVVSHPT
jgi:hypothetical protein